MKKGSLSTLLIVMGFFLIATISCKKNNLVIDQDVTPPSYVKFNRLSNNDTISTYTLNSASLETFKLLVGTTTVADKPRIIQFTYTSRNAVQGTQFTGPASITIPAGKALDTLTIQGLLAGYPSGTRIDTVTVRISGGDVPVNSYNNVYHVVIRKFCDVVLDNFKGDYKKTNELLGTGAYGPYVTSISSVTKTGATKGLIVVENIFDYGWGPITFELDFGSTNPSNFKVNVVPQTSGIADGGTIGAAYAGKEVMVRAFAGQTGTFSSCEQTFTLKMQLGVAGVGYFGDLYTVTMVR